jgi:VanZ family protein
MIATVSGRRQWPGFVSLVKADAAAAPTYRAVLATALLVCIVSWEPFDVTLDVGVIAGHLETLRASLWQASFSADHIIAFVLFLLFGFMLTQWIRELHVRSPVIVGIVTAMTAGIALEASQIFIESRLPTVADALANAAGAVAGVLVNVLDADVRSKLRMLTVVCLLATGVAIAQWTSGREAGFPALRNVGLCLIGAYVGVWSAARTVAQKAD